MKDKMARIEIDDLRDEIALLKERLDLIEETIGFDRNLYWDPVWSRKPTIKGWLKMIMEYIGIDIEYQEEVPSRHKIIKLEKDNEPIKQNEKG